MFYISLLVLYVTIAIGIIISLLINGVRPSKTLAWLLAIFTIPVGGILLYLMSGRNRRKNKLLRIKRKTFGKTVTTSGHKTLLAPVAYEKIIRLNYVNNHFPPTANNKVLRLKNGQATFENIFEALEKATSYIHLQYYIFEEGELADRLLRLFEAKIKLGVKVRLIYDGIGSFSLSKSYIKKLKSADVEVFPFLPFKFGRFLASINYRNHRKIIVIDGEVGFTGGINISDKYLKGDTNLGKWHDMHLKIEGNAVLQLNEVFLMDWQLVSGQQLEPNENPGVVNQPNGNLLVQIVQSGPDDDFPAIQQLYFSMINQAKNYLYITNPYIIPGYAIMTALETLALSGIDVRLLISENNDSKLVSWSVRSYFEPLLKAGVKIYLFPDGFLHSKIVISDDAIASVGTANIDVRSFEQNYEVNAVIYDRQFVNELKLDFLKDSGKSHLLTYDAHQERPWSARLKEGFAKVFSPLL